MLFASCDSSGGSATNDTDISDDGVEATDTTEEDEYSALPVSTDIELSGWNIWTTCTINFKLDEAASVTVGVKGDVAYKSYCYLDNITLCLEGSEENQLSNGDFETGNWSYEGWTLSDSGSICSVATNESSSNTSRSFKMSNWTSGETAVSVSLTQTVELSAGNYTASIQVDGDNEGTSTSALEFFAEIAESE